MGHGIIRRLRALRPKADALGDAVGEGAARATGPGSLPQPVSAFLPTSRATFAAFVCSGQQRRYYVLSTVWASALLTFLAAGAFKTFETYIVVEGCFEGPGQVRRASL
jgi:hypothetical protein